MTMTYVTINDIGENSLREWLPTILKCDNPDLDAWVDDITAKFDGSFGFDVTQNIEISGFHTANGRPEIFTFCADELDDHEIEDD